MVRGRKTTPEAVNRKRAKFQQLAERRTSEALKRIGLIENLANPVNYISTEKEVDQMLNVLEGAVHSLRERFKFNPPNLPKEFKFTPNKRKEVERVK